MKEIKLIFEAYTNTKEYSPDSAEAKRLMETTRELLTEIIPSKEFNEIENNLNLYANMLEETAFINGFKTAIRIMSASVVG